MNAQTRLDTAPLTDPVDRAQVRAFTKELRQQGKLSSNVAGIIVFAVVGVVFFFIIGPVFMGVMSSVAGRSSLSLVAAAPLLVFAAVIVVIVVGLIRGVGGAGVRRFRLDRFARANGMTWEPGFAKPQLPGMIFSLGGDRKNSDLLRSTSPRFIEVANYTYETGSGKSRQTHHWGYVALQLETPLPHIVLDAVGNNGLFGSNLPVTFGRDQRLSLEGDFDQHFALYCPEGYERDALYLFTPDVMARFVDNAAALDVEIIDDWLFLYAKRDLSTLDPATWQWLFTTIDAIDEKFAQWARWRDDRLAAEVAASRNAGTAASGAPAPSVPLLTPPPAGVAAQGRRLKRGFPVWTVVVGVAVVGWWILTTVFGR